MLLDLPPSPPPDKELIQIITPNLNFQKNTPIYRDNGPTEFAPNPRFPIRTDTSEISISRKMTYNSAWSFGVAPSLPRSRLSVGTDGLMGGNSCFLRFSLTLK